MRTIDLRKQQMLVRVREFGAMRRDIFPSSSQAGKLFAAVSAAVEALDQHLSEQPGGQGAPRDGATAKALAKRALQRRLATIATMAKALALDTPGLAEKFSVPLKCGEARLLVIARAFARDARPLAKQFVAHDMPSDFVAALGEEIDAFVAASSRVAASWNQSRATRDSIEATVDKAVRAVTKLNAIVRARQQDDPAAIASWDSARRIDYSPRTKRTPRRHDEAPTVPPVTTGTATV